MWTSTLDLDSAHVIPAKLLGLVWPGAYFSSFAPLQVQNLPRQPLPAANWVRVRNSLAGICGSDLHLIFVDGAFNIAPAALPKNSRSYPGHEVVGEVIEVGEEVHSLHVGERVVLRHGPNCVTAGVQPPCRSCVAGNYGLCENGSLPGPQPIGGGWSEEMLLHEHQLFPISPAISDAQAVLLEPSAVAVHAVLRCLPRAGERVLIIGAGTIGLLTLQVIRALARAAQVHIMARHAFQVERAANLDAKIIYPKESYQQISRLTSAHLYRGAAGNKMLLGGYDVIFDTIGSKRTTHDALRWARAGGTVVMVGVSLHQMRIDLTPVWYQEINLLGTTGHGMENWPPGTGEQKSTFEITAELITSEQIHPEELITQRYMLSEYRVALLDAKKKAHNRAIKVVFDFSLQPASVVPNVRAAARQPRIPASGDMRPSVNEPVYPPSAPTPPGARGTLSGHPGRQAGNEVMGTEIPLPGAYEREEATQKVVAVPPTPRQREVDPFTPADEPDPTTSSQQQSFNATTSYGGLPGFQPDLEQLGIPPLPVHEVEQGDQNYPVAQPETQVVTAHAEDNQDEEAATPALPVPPAIDFQPDMERDYEWAQFITPQNDSEDGMVAPAPPPAVSGRAEAEVSPSDDASQDMLTPADEINSPVAAPPAKRARSRRKTTELKTTDRKDTNDYGGEFPVKKNRGNFDVTNNSPQALQGREEPLVGPDSRNLTES